MRRVKFLGLLIVAVMLASVFSVTASAADPSVTLPSGVSFLTNPAVVTDGDFGTAWKISGSTNADVIVSTQTDKLYRLKYDIRVASGGTGIIVYNEAWGSVADTFTWEPYWELKYPSGKTTSLYPDFMNRYVTVEYILNTKNGSTELIVTDATNGSSIYKGSNTGSSLGIVPKYLTIRTFNGSNGEGVYFKNLLFEEYVLEMIESVNIEGTFEIGQTLTGTYTPKSGYESASCTYRWLASDKIDGDYEPLKDENGEELNDQTLTVKEAYAEKFIKFEVTPEADGVIGKAVLSDAIERAFKPIIETVYISGQKIAGKTLEGKYIFYDKNVTDNEAVTGSIYSWYRYDSTLGDFVVIPNENTRFYTVQEGDGDIKFGVIPVSDHEPNDYQTIYFSEAVTDPTAPVAKDVKIIGESKMNFELTGKYDFYDKNKDGEGASILTWYRFDSPDDTIPEPVGSGEKYTISDNDIGKYIAFGVKPIADTDSNEDPANEGVEALSELFICPCPPMATNVRIEGEPYLGKVLTGVYDYSHNLDIGEGESVYQWLISSAQTSGYTVISTESTLALDSSHVGKYVKFCVTPYASDNPKKGITVETLPVYVNSYIISSGLSGLGGGITVSGGGGGGGSSSSSSITDKTEDKKPQPVTQPMKFKDISGHWAYGDIEWAFKNGIVKGISEETFVPEKSLSAAELITMLVRGANIKITENNSQNSLWYEPYMEAAKKNGITKNTEIDKPDADISRAEMAILLVNTYEFMSGKELPTNENIIINDADLMNDEEIKAVKKAMTAGLLNGMGDNYYSPDTKTTRAQSAAIMKRLLNVK